MIKQKELIVIKIGTAVISKKDGSVDFEFMQNIAEQCTYLLEKYKILIVSSGAIGCGMKQLGFEARPKSIEQRQACAAVGQSQLMHFWKNAFGKQLLSQFLLSYDCFLDAQKYHNLLNCINSVLSFNAIPIINENDVIATDELEKNFGDNDKLSSLVAKAMQAKKLIMLCDVDGLFNKNPDEFSDAKLIPRVEKINNKIFSYASGKSANGVGGMHLKLKAIEIANKSGIEVNLCYGKKKDSVLSAFSNDFAGTIFYPE